MADEYEIETDEDPVFAAITPKKTNKWGILALGFQWAAGLTHETADLFQSLGCAAVQRYLYEQDRENWSGELSREIEAFQGFYIVAEPEEEEEE
jgi:hypothetical protein